MSLDTISNEPRSARPLYNVADGQNVSLKRAAARAATAPLAEVDLGAHLSALCAAFKTAASARGPAFELRLELVDGIAVRPGTAATIGQIVTEAVRNAIEYAHPAGVGGVIKVGCRSEGETALLVEVADDGVGLPEGFDPDRDGAFGFGLMRELARTLDARIRFISTPLGLSVRLRAPRTASEARLFSALFPELQAALSPPREGDWTSGFLDALPVAVYTTDAVGRITFFNRAAVALWGRRPELGDEWCGSWRLYWPDGRPMPHGDCPMGVAIREERSIMGGEAVAERPDGTRVPFMAYPSPLHDASGTLVGAVNTLVDISDRKSAEDRQTLLAREIHHRTKNLLAVVQSIVSRSLVGERTLEDGRTVVLGRLAALAATYDNLITTSWEGVEFGEIVRRELKPFAGQLDIEGPAILLNPQSAQNFTLAIHELATNAAKYGALSVSTGRVSVRWETDADPSAPHFRFAWRETGGPAVTRSERRGFGAMMLEQVITHDFDCPPRIEFMPEGLNYALDVSLAAIMAEEGDNRGVA